MTSFKTIVVIYSILAKHYQFTSGWLRCGNVIASFLSVWPHMTLDLHQNLIKIIYSIFVINTPSMRTIHCRMVEIMWSRDFECLISVDLIWPFTFSKINNDHLLNIANTHGKYDTKATWNHWENSVARYPVVDPCWPSLKSIGRDHLLDIANTCQVWYQTNSKLCRKIFCVWPLSTLYGLGSPSNQ